jgi:4-amino-4-deoxy-L-arabinose transferase-like glycosyltransferase
LQQQQAAWEQELLVIVLAQQQLFWRAAMSPARSWRSQTPGVAVAGLLIVSAALLVAQRSWFQREERVQMLSAQSPDAPPTRLNDMSDAAFLTKIRKVPGAGYSSSSVEGVEAKALLAQATATAKKGRAALEDASSMHLELQEDRKQLLETIKKKQDWLAKGDAEDKEADESQESAAQVRSSLALLVQKYKY